MQKTAARAGVSTLALLFLPRYFCAFGRISNLNKTKAKKENSTAATPEPSQNLRTVTCPHCKNPAVFAPSNPYRPFCSERCRLIDLGDWASEKFRVPATNDGSVQDLPEESDPEQD